MKPTLSPSQLATVILVYQSQLRFSNIDCTALIACSTPCIQSIIAAQAKVSGVSVSNIIHVNCTDSGRRRHTNLQTSRFKKHVEVIKNVTVITKTIIPVPEGAVAAQLIFKNTTTALSIAAQTGLFTVVLRNISTQNNAVVLSKVFINSAPSGVASISTATANPSISVTTSPSFGYNINNCIVELFLVRS